MTELEGNFPEQTDRSLGIDVRRRKPEGQKIVGLEQVGDIVLDQSGLRGVEGEGAVVEAKFDQPGKIDQTAENFFTRIKGTRRVKSSRDRHCFRSPFRQFRPEVDRNPNVSGD